GHRDCKEIYEVKVSNLCFGYEEEFQVLKNINFSLNKSDIIHVKGTNGSGKSTLISLLIGYYDNYNGEIAINGIDLKTYNIKKIRKLISILP
ncbi:ATP-binding cassette domain-containing protein, partial [Klebsiella pneumoniae]|nr:ATP-binding cassette domain-containing protein [Klebsiella pneumoniae]